MELLQGTIVHLQQNKVMEYEWGCEGDSNLIYQLTKKHCKKYAQLWMGTHKNGPSILPNKQTLAEYLKQQNIADLPFLFKILCIDKALSIQLHPNKQQAQRLFVQKHGIYPDDNQKPEMFYTLTEFQCFFGIITHEELSDLCSKPPFSLLQSKDSFSVKSIISQLCSLSKQTIQNMIDQLIGNADSLFPDRKQIIDKIQKQFPYDVGILVSCFLKYKKLQPGVCMAIAAGVPHAYLRGTCFQIMKNSDNVVRLGLTPKLKDIPTLLEIMNETIGLDGIKVQKSNEGYQWNGLIINEFEHFSQEEVDIDVKYLSIGIVLEKQFNCDKLGIKAGKGTVLFLGPGKYRAKGPFRFFIGSYAQ